MEFRNYLLGSCIMAVLGSCTVSQKTNLNLVLSRDVLYDKVKGAWAGQIIGCTYGGPQSFSTCLP